MSWGRLLLAALLLCSLSAFTQDQPLSQDSAWIQHIPEFRMTPAATSAEPWRILPKTDSNKDARILMKPQVDTDGTLVLPGGPVATENTCFAIRSYVVARDSKESDSVHPVRYTTCVPAAKYRLKTADAQVVLVR